ncbi:MAG: phosphoribosyltransferase family protein [Anaeromyxobacter sp.]
MLGSALPAPRLPDEENAIATQRKSTRTSRGARPASARKPAAAKKGRGRAGAAAKPARRGAARRPPSPELEGTDGFAPVTHQVGKVRAPAKPGVREIGWAAFGEIVKNLAARIQAKYRPAAVVGIARGGVFVGGALSTALGAEFYPIRIERRRRDMGVLPHAVVELPDLGGKRVLVVDDLASTGATLARARAVSKKAGAGEVKTAVLVARSGARPDFSVFETEDVILFAWDYDVAGGGGSGGAVDPGEVGV